MFKNLTMFRFSPAVGMDILCRLSQELTERDHIRNVGPMEMFTTGFSPVENGGELLMWIGTTAFVVCAMNQRVISPDQIAEGVHKACQRIDEEEGRKVSGREKKRIRDDVINALIPNAPVKRIRTLCLLDTSNGFIAIDTASLPRAERCIQQIRELLGSFPAMPLYLEESPRVLLTSWLSGACHIPVFSMGDECQLVSGEGSIARYKHQDLGDDDVQENLRNGKVVDNIGVVINDNVSFVLTSALQLKRLDFTNADYDDVESYSQQLALQALEISQLATQLFQIFICKQPTD